jgi:hypothetical protein
MNNKSSKPAELSSNDPSVSPLLDKNDQTEGEKENFAVLLLRVGRGDEKSVEVPYDIAKAWQEQLSESLKQRSQPPVQEVMHSASKDAPDSNELVEALKQNVRAFRNKDTGEIVHGMVGELPNNWEDVMIIPNISNEAIDAALAQSPSVGLNTKKGGE